MVLHPTHMSNLSDAQEHVLSFISIAPAMLSMAASSTILYLVWKSGFTTAYKRILFGLSVSDIITSITYMLQPFLTPAETSQRLWASGNDATCTLLGTISQLTLSTWLYNGVLSYYYLFIIRFGVRETAFARRYEPWMHAVAIGYPVVTAITGAGMNLYHEVDIGHGCWISGYPEGCSEEEGECKGDIFGWLFMGLWTILVIISIAVINLVIYLHVKRQMKRGSRRSFSGDQQTKRIKEVAVQAFLYVAAFAGTFVWTVVLKVMDSQNYDAKDEAKLFPLMVLNGLLVPSTGLFNLGIYLRPRYIKTRSDFPNESVLWAVKRALYGESIPPTASASTDFPLEESPTVESFAGKGDGPTIVNINSPESCPGRPGEESTSSSTSCKIDGGE